MWVRYHFSHSFVHIYKQQMYRFISFSSSQRKVFLFLYIHFLSDRDRKNDEEYQQKKTEMTGKNHVMNTKAHEEEHNCNDCHEFYVWIHLVATVVRHSALHTQTHPTGNLFGYKNDIRYKNVTFLLGKILGNSEKKIYFRNCVKGRAWFEDT